MTTKLRSATAAYLLIAFLGPTSAQWFHYVVDSQTKGTCVRVRNNVPHIAYYSEAGLKYAIWGPSGWRIDTVDSRRWYHNGNPALAFDSVGNPRIAYYCGTPWYARWSGSEWMREQIDPDSAGDYISLAFDSLGWPHVAYSKQRSLYYFKLKYARRDQAGWLPVLADSLGGASCVLAFDPRGRPCVSHCESWSDGRLLYSTRADTGWTKEVVVAGSTSQSFMVLDGNGDPHVSYFSAGGGNYDLRYAGRVGGAWRTEVIDHGQQLNKRGWDNCIVRDQQGVCHVSYHAHNEKQVRYARGRFGSWQVEVVNSAGGWDLGSSIDLDVLGRPCIAWVHEDQNHALYLSCRYELTDIAQPALRPAEPRQRAATIVRGMIHVRGDDPAVLLGITGQKQMELSPGANDVRHLAAGVYYVRQETGNRLARVVVARY